MIHNLKVVRILDEYRIIINAGSNQGVTSKTKFEIVGVFDKIYDPDSKKLLGSIPTVKASVSPVSIQPNLCVCKNTNIVKNQMQLLIEIEGMQTSDVGFPDKLNVDKSQISNPEIFEPIRIGDNVLMYDENSIQCSDITGIDTKK